MIHQWFLFKATIPYSYSVIDCKMNNLLKLREELLKGSLLWSSFVRAYQFTILEQTTKISVNDLIVKAVGVTLRVSPYSCYTLVTLIK